MELFRSWLHARRRGLGLGVLCTAVFAVVFYLYRLPLPAVAYAAAICLLFCLLFVGRDFVRYCRLRKRLSMLKGEVGITLEHLPTPRDAVEADYQALLAALLQEKQALVQKEQTRYRDLVEYYTIWVHQIKTPIAAMELLLQSAPNPDPSELSGELRRIEQYVEMVLTYLRLDADNTDYVIGEYDLDGIVRQALRKYASGFIRRKISLSYVPVNCRVLTDEKWLLFVIEQVLSNALKYTRAGSVSIYLETPQTLCIRDTGIGIAPEDLPRIFEKGYTGCNGRQDKHASGIGLYLCRRILTALGHRISVASRPGGGTLVRLDLRREALEVE